MADEVKVEGETPAPDSSKAELEALQTKTVELEKQLEATGRERDTAKQYVQTLMTQVQQMVNGADKSTDAVDFREKFSSDPEATLNEFFAKRVGPVYEEFLNTSAVSGREIAKAKLGASWTKHEKEVDDFMKRMPADVRARPDSWENALKYVRSQHLEDEVKEEVSKRLESEKRAAVEIAGPPATPRTARKTLSDEEKKIARALEIEENDYIAMRNQMTVDPRGGGHLQGE